MRIFAGRGGHRRNNSGFTLVELSVVLVVIAAILGATMMGANLYRGAIAQRLYVDFILGWRQSYTSYITVTSGALPGDSVTAPANAINGSVSSPLCSTDLINAMLAKGVDLPSGRGSGYEDRYSYTDKSGTPHELKVCLITVPWSVPSGGTGVYKQVNRHVMRVQGVTAELAMLVDSQTDGAVDARFGSVREDSIAENTDTASSAWSHTGTDTIGGKGEGEAAEVTMYILLSS